MKEYYLPLSGGMKFLVKRYELIKFSKWLEIKYNQFNLSIDVDYILSFNFENFIFVIHNSYISFCLANKENLDYYHNNKIENFTSILRKKKINNLLIK